jgi:hypothetical protein
MSRDVSLSDAHSLSLGQANFRTRYGSIGAVDGQDARMLRAHGRVRATLMGGCVGLMIRRAPARVAGQ